MTSAKPAIMNASNAGRKAPAKRATKRKRAPATTAAKQSKKAGESSGEPPAAAAADSGNAGKTRYRSLRMNAGIHAVVLYQIFFFCLSIVIHVFTYLFTFRCPNEQQDAELNVWTAPEN